MNEFYKVVVKVEFETEKGQIKKRTENYLVAAVSPTDAEAKMVAHLNMSDMEIRSISKSNIIEVISK
jgi:hypothetical protein